MTIEVDGATVGLATCYDLRFPGLFQLLADAGPGWSWCPPRGAPVRASASSGICWSGPARSTRRPSWPPATRPTRPRSAATPGRAPTGIGASAVAGPLGAFVDQLGPGPGLLLVDIDLGEVDAARKVVPVLANRRF